MRQWKRWRAPRGTVAAETQETIASPLVATERPWILFVGAGEAAHGWLRDHGEGLPVISPPEEPALPIAVHRLAPPGLSGERILFVPRIDAGFFDTLTGVPFSASSPLYLLPKLAQLASEDQPLHFVATALDAKQLLSRKGLASRFEIRGEGGAAPSAPVGASEATTVDGLLEAGLATRDPELRSRLYGEALEKAPGDGLVHLFLAGSLLERRRLPEAVDVLRASIARSPELACAHYELGKALVQTDDMDGALAAFRTATELLPEYSSAWGNLGAALGEMQRQEEAASALKRAVALDPTNHALHSNLGATYRDQGKLEAAEACLEKALSISPDFVFGYYNLAGLHYLSGRFDEAIALFEKAQSLDETRSPRQGLLLAATRLASGDTEGALRDYRDVFGRLEGQMKVDMRTVAEWDLQGLAQRVGVSSSLREAVSLVRSLA